MVTVDLRIEAKSGVPYYRQIIDQVRCVIAYGNLRPGDRFPPVRRLAVDLSVSPNTVIHAYRELEMEGVLDTRQGSGMFVSHRPPGIKKIERERILDQVLTELLARALAYGFSLDDVFEGLLKQEKKTRIGETPMRQTGTRRSRDSPLSTSSARCVQFLAPYR